MVEKQAAYSGYWTMELTYDHFIILAVIIYLLLTKFVAHIVNYRLSFSSLIYGPGAKCMGHNCWGKNKDL